MILENFTPVLKKADTQLVTGLENLDPCECKEVYNQLIQLQLEIHKQYLHFYSQRLSKDD